MDEVERAITSAWIVEPLDKGKNGGLAAATGAHERQSLGRRDREIEIAKDHRVGPRRVGEVDASELDSTSHGRERSPVGAVRVDLRCSIDDLEHPPRCHRALCKLRVVRQRQS